MIDVAFGIVCVVIAMVIGWRTFRVLTRHPHRSLNETVDLPEGIPVCDIGLVERDLANLTTVMVVADRIEDPAKTTLAEALQRNFERGVKYIFLVSRDRAQQEIKGYYKVLWAYASIETEKRGGGNVSNLIDIQTLPYNWDDYPYIFYTIQLPGRGEKTLAFRGDGLKEGIADHYGRVDPILAHTVARAIVSEAPQSLSWIEVERQQFESLPKVILFSRPPATTKLQ